MPNFPYPYEVNWKLVTGNGCLTPILTAFTIKNSSSSCILRRPQKIGPSSTYIGGFQLIDLIMMELKSQMICYNSIPFIG